MQQRSLLPRQDIMADTSRSVQMQPEHAAVAVPFCAQKLLEVEPLARGDLSLLRLGLRGQLTAQSRTPPRIAGNSRWCRNLWRYAPPRGAPGNTAMHWNSHWIPVSWTAPPGPRRLLGPLPPGSFQNPSKPNFSCTTSTCPLRLRTIPAAPTWVWSCIGSVDGRSSYVMPEVVSQVGTRRRSVLGMSYRKPAAH